MFKDFKIIAFEHVSGISRNSDENIWERQSTCYQTVLKFYISQKEMFSHCICLGLMKNYDESAGVLVSAVTVTCEHVHSPKAF